MNIFIFLQLGLILTGAIFAWVASTKRTQLHPYHSNCDSVHLFKRQSWYTQTGYKLHLSGFLMIYAGFLSGAIHGFITLTS